LRADTFKEWYQRFQLLEEGLRASYPASSDFSWVFSELSQIGVSLAEIDKMQEKYRKGIQDRAPADFLESLKMLLRQQENFVAQVITQAVEYCKTFEEKL
jgi:hypothetical protein